MTVTKEKIATEAQDQVEKVVSWVGDVATKVADAASEVVDNIDVDSAKETASDTASGVVEKFAAVAAPMAVVASKKRWKGGTFVGLVISAAASYFFDPKKGEERRSKVKQKVSSVFSTVAEKLRTDEPEASPSSSAA